MQIVLRPAERTMSTAALSRLLDATPEGDRHAFLRNLLGSLHHTGDVDGLRVSRFDMPEADRAAVLEALTKFAPDRIRARPPMSLLIRKLSEPFEEKMQ